MENEVIQEDMEKKDEESLWTRCRKIYSFVPKQSCFPILVVLMGESIVESAVISTLITYLTDVRMDTLTAAAMTVNLLEVLSGLLSIPATYYKNVIGCFRLTIISSAAYSMGLGFMYISGTQICWHKIESPLFYTAIVLLVIGKAGFSSSCVTDFLEHQVEAKLNEQEESKIAIKIQSKVMMAKDKYEREAIKDEEYRKISIDDMMKEDKILEAVHILSSISKTIGVILGTAIASYLNNWVIRFAVSAVVLPLTLVVFIMGWFFASYVYRGHCYNTWSPGGCNTDKIHPIMEPTVNGNNANVTFKESVTNNKARLLSMVPICLTFIMYGIVKSAKGSYFLEQGNSMDRSVGRIHMVPLPVLLIIGSFFGQVVNTLGWKILYKRLRANERIKGILIMIGIGLMCSCLCCGAARWSENTRLEVVRENGLLDYPDEIVPLRLYYLLPQFISYGTMKHLAGTGLEVFFEYELPESMEEYASGLADIVIGIGGFFGVIAVPVTQKLSETLGGNSTGWFADTLNRSHLDYFYTTLGIFCLLNIGLYAYVSTSYFQKRTSPNKESPKEEWVIALEV